MECDIGSNMFFSTDTERAGSQARIQVAGEIIVMWVEMSHSLTNIYYTSTVCQALYGAFRIEK